MKIDIVSQTIVALLEKEMFYAEVIMQMRRIYNTHLNAVAGVCIKDTVELHINPMLFEKEALEQRIGILRHECEHILRDHIPRMKEIHPEVFSKDIDSVESLINGQKFKCLNISADCAINGHIKGIPEWGVFPKDFELNDGETMEWYFENLKNNEKMKQISEFDGHSLWSESTEDKEILREKIRQAVNKAAVRTRAAGQMTSNHEMLVEKLNEVSVSWKQQLRRFVARSLDITSEETRKKRNRRYGIHVPGQKKIEQLHIGVATDCSGSVSDEAYTQFMSEIVEIGKYAKVTVVDADCEVKTSYEYKKGMKLKRHGHGGTAYQPAFDYFNKIKDIDAVIYFGDMDCADAPAKPKYPVLWAVVGNQHPPASFGNRIQVKEL
jgi:predicted metal-dependent peptidase